MSPKNLWDWPYPMPEWQDQPNESSTGDPRAPGRDDSPEADIIASSKRGNTSEIEDEIDRLVRRFKRGDPPKQPPSEPPRPPWPQDRGSDMCAWYYSFRYGDIFGIYICEECVDRIASELWLHGIPYDIALKIAFSFIYGHEIFHYRVDRAVEMLELSVSRAIGSSTQMWMNRWRASKHHKPRSGLDLLEEACANLHGLTQATTRAKEEKPATSTVDYSKISGLVLCSMMDNSGPGYRDYSRVGYPNTQKSQDDLISWYLLLTGRAVGVPSAPIENLGKTITSSRRKGNLRIDPKVPLYWVKC